MNQNETQDASLFDLSEELVSDNESDEEGSERKTELPKNVHSLEETRQNPKFRKWR